MAKDQRGLGREDGTPGRQDSTGRACRKEWGGVGSIVSKLIEGRVNVGVHMCVCVCVVVDKLRPPFSGWTSNTAKTISWMIGCGKGGCRAGCTLNTQ